MKTDARIIRVAELSSLREKAQSRIEQLSAIRKEVSSLVTSVPENSEEGLSILSMIDNRRVLLLQKIAGYERSIDMLREQELAVGELFIDGKLV